MNLKNKEIKIGLIFALIAINCLIIASANFVKLNQSSSFSTNLNVSEIISKEIKQNNFNKFPQDFSVFGYKLIASDIDPIDRDEDGILILSQNRANFVNIALKLEFDDFDFYDIPIYGELYLDRVGNKEFCYTIEDPYKGFFMKLVFDSEMSYIDLAFDGEYCQYYYEGLNLKGFNSFNPHFTQEIKIIQLNTLKESSQTTFTELTSKLKELQKNNIIISQNENFASRQQTLGITFTDYGIAHEAADASTVNLAEDLPDDYWEPYTEIDIGIYRRTPTESQIKSDLQYYNKDYIQNGHGYIRNIKAYAIYAHSNPTKNTAWFIREYWIWNPWPFKKWIQEWIYPSEIEDLWYHTYNPGTHEEVDVYPWDMIIHATVCEGYSGNDGVPHMAKAFVDEGAEAFVGATVGIPFKHNDEFTGDFWFDLCQLDKTIYQATQSYISTHNYYDDYPTEPENLNIDWIYGTHIKIYGNTNAKLNN